MRTVFTFALLLAFAGTYAQGNQKNSFGFNVAVGTTVIRANADLVGGPSRAGRTSFELGFNYFKKITDRLSFESGVDYHQNQIKVTPSFHPNIDRRPRLYDFRLLYIPVFARWNFSKNGFFNGGVLVDIDISNRDAITDQSGVGLGLGFGRDIPLSENVSLSINPFLNFHGLVLVNSGNYSERIVDVGMRIGIRSK
jgi:hypothetical protein